MAPRNCVTGAARRVGGGRRSMAVMMRAATAAALEPSSGGMLEWPPAAETWTCSGRWGPREGGPGELGSGSRRYLEEAEEAET